MGSFLSSPTPPPDEFVLVETEPLPRSSGSTRSQFNSNLNQYSGRRYPLDPNGHSNANLFRRRLHTSAGMQIPAQTYQEWDLEPLLINHGPDVLEHKAGAGTSDGSGSDDENDIDKPLNFKLGKLAAFNIGNRDRTIEKLRNEVKELNKQLMQGNEERLRKAANA